MKIRAGFVSNSSSTSFMVKNKSNQQKTIVDFAKETKFLVADFKSSYSWYENDPTVTIDDYINSAQSRYNSNPLQWTLFPGDESSWVFGDEEGDLIGRINDYMLRHGGKTESFEWKFDEYLR